MHNDFLLASIKRTISAPNDKGEAHVNHEDTGRSFLIRRQPAGLHVSEMVPTGMFVIDEKAMRFERDDAFMQMIKNNPNNIRLALQAQGRTRDQLCSAGGGFGKHSIYYPDEQAAANAIGLALESNAFHRDSMTEEQYNQQQGKHRLLMDAVREATASVQYWNDRINGPATKGGILDGAQGMFGELSEKSRNSLLSFMNQPNEENWENCHSVIISGTSSAWSAWTKSDKSAPHSKPVDGAWPAIPTPEVLIKAIRDTVKRDRENAMERQMEAERGLVAAQRALANFESGRDNATGADLTRSGVGGSVIHARFNQSVAPVIDAERIKTFLSKDGNENSKTQEPGSGMNH